MANGTREEAAAQIRSYIELSDQIKDLKRQAKDLEAQKRELEATCLDWFTEEGVSNMTMEGKLIYLHRQSWASAPPTALDILSSEGIDGVAMVSAQKLSAVVREYETTEEFYEQHPKLKDLVNVDERVSLRVRKK